jgi:Ca2+-binding RTX toxin-like protein
MTTLDIARVSTTATGAQTGSYITSAYGSLSSDGHLIAFQSNGDTLVAGDLNNRIDIFVKNLATGAVTLASSSAAGVLGDGTSSGASLSADGTLVAFTSLATNLVAGDTTGKMDIFVKTLATGAIQRVSVAADGTQGDNDARLAHISADGKFVLFDSYASNMVAGDTNASCDVFLKNLATGAVTLVSSDAAGVEGNSSSYGSSLSANGRYVVFESTATNLVAGDTNSVFDVFVKDLTTGAIQRVSTSSAGAQGTAGSSGASISADGRYVAFGSTSANLLASVDGTSSGASIYVKDLTTGTLQLVSADASGVSGHMNSKNAVISADGHYVAFVSDSDNLVAGDTNGKSDVFIKNLATGAIQRVSTSAAGVEGDNYSGTDTPAFSADGKYLVFSSGASNLVAGDTNSGYDIFRVVNPFYTASGGSTGGTGGTAVSSAVTSILAAGKLDLTLTGSKAINGTGNGADNQLTGNDGANVLDGAAGNDTLDGGAGNDILKGGAGNDTLMAGSGNDTFDGGAGNDLLDLGAHAFADKGKASGFTVARPNATTVLITDSVTHQTFTIKGAWDPHASGDRGIESYKFSDQTVSLDQLIANTASTFADTLTGDGSGTTLSGGAGNDTYVVTSALDVVSENDAVTGKDTGGIDTIQTTLASYDLAIKGDHIENLSYTGSVAFTGTGNALANTLAGGAGNDSLDGGLGADKLIGGAGDDTYLVDNVGDKVVETAASGGAGIDTIRTGLASLSLAGLPDVENLAYTGNNGIFANFTGTGNAAANQIAGNGGNDKLLGLGGDDILSGGGGNDSLVGGDGNDTLDGGSGADRLDGGLGTDTARMTGSVADYQVALKAGNLLTLAANGVTDTLLGIEKVVFDNGTAATADDTTFDVNAQPGGLLYNRPTYLADSVTGTDQGEQIDGLEGNDSIFGLAGSDTLIGGAGNDSLAGGAGSDTLAGGAGNDSFIFDAAPGADNIDVIMDFVAGDKLLLAHGAFAELAVGTVAADAFYAGTAAHDASDRLIYDKTSGHLYYDADGNGDGQAMLIATLGTAAHPAITAASFGVVA